MDLTENSTIYVCGLCKQNCVIDTIQSHPCTQEYEHVILTESNYFYPQTADGQIINKANQGHYSDTNVKESNKENDTSHNDNSDVTIAAMEEILIAAVQERPCIWNYKDFLPSQRTKAIKDKLWQEIEDILNTNKKKKQYSIATLKAKWKNLYDTYRTYLMKEKGKSGQAANKSKPWRFMKQMSFLKDTFDVGIRKTVSNLTLPTSEDKLFNDLFHDDVEPKVDDVHNFSENHEVNKGNKKQKTDDAIERIAKALSEPIPPPQILQQPFVPMPELKEKDEISSFCSTMDKKLHNLRPKQANLAMFKIYELLFKFENENDFV